MLTVRRGGRGIGRGLSETESDDVASSILLRCDRYHEGRFERLLVVPIILCNICYVFIEYGSIESSRRL
jgi:hypothetical protein